MQHSKLLSLVLTALWVGPSLADAVTSFVADRAVYDYVIVGGLSLMCYLFCPLAKIRVSMIAGTAGLVLANRLSANSNVTVLVIEAGVRYIQLWMLLELCLTTLFLSVTMVSFQCKLLFLVPLSLPVRVVYIAYSECVSNQSYRYPLGLELHHRRPTRVGRKDLQLPSWKTSWGFL